jgi:hypothetical protein
MKYQIGDDIIVLHSSEEGKVIDIISDKMVMIEIRGVKFPAYMDQIDFPYFYRFSKKKLVPDAITKPKLFIDSIPKEKPQPNTIKALDGVWISIIPKFALDDFDDEVVESLKIYLINKTNISYNFTYNFLLKQEPHFGINSSIDAFHDFYIHDVPFANINDSPSFLVEFSLKTANKNMADFYETNLKLKAKQIFDKIEKIKKENVPTINYKLFDDYPIKVIEEKFDISKLVNKGFKVYDAGKIKENLIPARSVVDLHIEKLTNDFGGKTNFEILSIQLKEFEKWYHLAVANYMQSFIVIHGIGKGTLKDEIHSILKAKKEVKSFINQYDNRFGYGATEIFFKY